MTRVKPGVWHVCNLHEQQGATNVYDFVTIILPERLQNRTFKVALSLLFMIMLKNHLDRKTFCAEYV